MPPDFYGSKIPPWHPLSTATWLHTASAACLFGFFTFSSPFLLEATVRHQLQQLATPSAEKIAQNIHVDNVILPADSVEYAEKCQPEAKTIFRQANMNLRSGH